MLTKTQADRRAARARLAHERVTCMQVVRCEMVRVLGIAPYKIDKLFGVHTVEFDRTGKSMPLNKWQRVPVVAFELRHPEGKSTRYPTLREARHAAAMAASMRRQEGGGE